MTTWKFERKNSQEKRHMVWNGATNRPVKKALLDSTHTKLFISIIIKHTGIPPNDIHNSTFDNLDFQQLLSLIQKVWFQRKRQGF